MHRTGRTGRAGETGVAVSFVGARDWNLMISIQRYLQVAFSRRVLSGLKARYNGPKKQKTSGKAVGSKRKKTDAQSKKSAKQSNPLDCQASMRGPLVM